LHASNVKNYFKLSIKIERLFSAYTFGFRAVPGALIRVGQNFERLGEVQLQSGALLLRLFPAREAEEKLWSFSNLISRIGIVLL
jgi:hypothetical protein